MNNPQNTHPVYAFYCCILKPALIYGVLLGLWYQLGYIFRVHFVANELAYLSYFSVLLVGIIAIHSYAFRAGRLNIPVDKQFGRWLLLALVMSSVAGVISVFGHYLLSSYFHFIHEQVVYLSDGFAEVMPLGTQLSSEVILLNNSLTAGLFSLLISMFVATLVGGFWSIKQARAEARGVKSLS